jgi:DNA repair ATPase RecN
VTREEHYVALQEISNGASWYHVDLHIHTPASKDHDWGKVEPRDVVKALVDKKLDLVAITDHFSGEWVDKIKEACRAHAKDNRNNDKIPIILPGVEISVGGIHLNLIFSEEKNTAHINHVLSRLKVPPEIHGNPEYTLSLGIEDAINVAKSEGAIVVGVHCHSEKGVVGGLDGLLRQQALESVDFLELHGIRNPQKNLETILFVRDRLDYKKIPFIMSSDAHKADGLFDGCLVKMASPNFRGLQQIIYEPELRLCSDGSPVSPDFKILGVTVEGEGVYENIVLPFNAGLNVVIGGRGAGKSALLDTIRFALGNAPRSEELADNLSGHYHRIYGLYVEGTAIRVYYQHGSEVFCAECSVSIKEIKGKIFKYSPQNQPRKYRLVDSQFVEKDEHLPIPFEILSQGEIQSLIDQSEELIDFLDRYDPFIEIHKLSIDQGIEKCQEIEKQIFKLQAELNEIHTLRTRITELRDRRVLLENILNSVEYNEFQKVSNLNAYIQPIRSESLKFNEAIEFLKKSVAIFENRLETIPNENQDIIKEIKNILESLTKESNVIIIRLNSLKEKTNDVSSKWEKHMKSTEEIFITHLESTGRSGRRDLVEQKRELDKNLLDCEKRLENLTKIEIEVEELHIRFESCANNLIVDQERVSDARSLVIEDLNSKLGGRIHLNLNINKNAGKLYDALDKLFSGHSITPKDASIIKLVESFTGLEIYKLISTRNIEILQTVITSANANKVVSVSRGEDFYSLARTLNGDVPQVFLNKNGDNRPLAELSHGEKVSALLPILMLDNRSPLLIDQPEDDLDHAFITENIVETIRSSRGRRQILVITHNANIPVLGDADLVIKVERRESEKRCEVVSAEGLEAESSMNALKLLEGGQEAFERRSQKYKAAIN